MKIWVGCLAAYNAGCLHGDWFDLGDYSELDDLMDAIKTQVLNTSPEPGAEEFAIFDGDEVPSSLMRGMYPDITAIFEYASALADLEDSELEAFAAWWDNMNSSDTPDIEQFREAFYGEYRSVEEYAEEFADECGLLESVSESLKDYFDFAAYGRDMEHNGDIWTADSDGGCFIFSGCC